MGALLIFRSMLKRIAVLIDGGHVRAPARRARLVYSTSFIEKFSRLCAAADEEILRVLYYDCAPFTGTAKLPVSGSPFAFTGRTSG